METARRLLAATENLTPSERRKFLALHHSEGGSSPHIAQRAMMALRWVHQRARAYNVPIGAVRLAYTGVEALARLEAVRPHQASEIAEAALTGRLTARDVMAIASAAESRSREGPTAWEVFLTDEVAPWMPPGPATALVAASEMSEWGQLLRVDIEWRAGNGDVTAVFFEPGTQYSQNAQFSDVLPRLIAAQRFFPRVIYITWSNDDASFFASHPIEQSERFSIFEVCYPPGA